MMPRLSSNKPSPKDATMKTEGELLDGFPLEIISRVLLKLPYQYLLSVPGVSKTWKNLMESDPELRVQRFKKASQVYVEAGDGSSDEPVEPGSEKVRLHPVLRNISFVFGHGAAHLIVENDVDDTELGDTAVAHDFISIPAVQHFTINIEEDTLECEYQIEVKNPQGVTVLDVFTELAAAREVETPEGPMAIVEALCGHRFYEGFSAVKRTGTALSASLSLGS
ncbi:hypothetical protein B0H19DRAFT_521640 [Mycena capillaripes]|nr:hypothetical protein B0H19DRAFT_521640 [Mycena capillaripes]